MEGRVVRDAVNRIRIVGFYKGLNGMDKFKPQGTTMKTFSKIEQRLYDDFVRFGYSDEVSRSIAHSFTQYVLGYLDDRGVVDCLMKSGAEHDLAEAVLNSFKLAKKTDANVQANVSERSLAGCV